MQDARQPQSPSFENAFASVENSAAKLLEVAGRLARTAKAIRKSAHDGDISKMRAEVSRLPDVQILVSAAVESASSAWPFEANGEEAYLANGYADELIAAARDVGVAMVELGDRYAAFPSVVRILPAQRAVQVDRRRVTAIRPSRLVELLRKAQATKPQLKPEQFIEVLHAAYRLVGGPDRAGSTVVLTDVYDVLTLLPDVRRGYAGAEFVRDLYLLDQSGVRETRKGAELRLTAASGTKTSKDVLTIVGPSGETHTYYGVRFQERG